MYEDTDKADETANEDRFKPVFKYFKAKKPPPDLTKVRDFSTENSNVKTTPITDQEKLSKLGLNPLSQWSIVRVEDISGLYVVRNPFTNSGQLYWALRCLRDFAKNPPNRTNLDQSGTNFPGDKRKIDETEK